MKLIQCPKCIVGHIEEGEDYSNATHIAKCNNCSSEFWINYTKVYDLETLKNEYNQKSGGESPQDPLASRSWTRIDPGIDPGLLLSSQMLEFANLFHQIGFLQTLDKEGPA